MRLLAIDTSAAPVSAALLQDGFLAGEFFLNTKTTHSQTLMPLIESLLSLTSCTLRDIDVIAVNAGPGSFTGVRIGVASVKGMTLPEEKPCAAVSTLAAMAYGLPYQSGLVCAVMDARCSQVYNALFRLRDGKVERLTPDRALSIEELLAELQTMGEEVIYLVGDGAELCYQTFGERLPSAVLTPMNLRYQHAYGTAKAAEQLIAENRLCSSDELMPTYLRLPQAERELKARQQKETLTARPDGEKTAVSGGNP